jgi:hypothetical protein
VKNYEQQIIELSEKKQGIIKYKNNLDTIKSLKQQVLGQEIMIEELNNQIINITETVSNNEQEIEIYN